MEIIHSQTWGLVNLVMLGEDYFALTSEGMELTRGTAEFCKGYVAGFDNGYSGPSDFLDE